jgi:hypothetical protein
MDNTGRYINIKGATHNPKQNNKLAIKQNRIVSIIQNTVGIQI